VEQFVAEGDELLPRSGFPLTVRQPAAITPEISAMVAAKEGG
jgi:hypothetical protein